MSGDIQALLAYTYDGAFQWRISCRYIPGEIERNVIASCTEKNMKSTLQVGTHGAQGYNVYEVFIATTVGKCHVYPEVIFCTS